MDGLVAQANRNSKKVNQTRRHEPRRNHPLLPKPEN